MNAYQGTIEELRPLTRTALKIGAFLSLECRYHIEVDLLVTINSFGEITVLNHDTNATYTTAPTSPDTYLANIQSDLIGTLYLRE